MCLGLVGRGRTSWLPCPSCSACHEGGCCTVKHRSSDLAVIWTQITQLRYNQLQNRWYHCNQGEERIPNKYITSRKNIIITLKIEKFPLLLRDNLDKMAARCIVGRILGIIYSNFFFKHNRHQRNLHQMKGCILMFITPSYVLWELRFRWILNRLSDLLCQ